MAENGPATHVLQTDLTGCAEAASAPCGIGTPGDDLPALAGFIRSGMLDWPGKITATAFLSGCPLRCPYCHNPELIHLRRAREPVSALLSHLRERREWLDGVVVSGGEPTATSGIETLLRVIKDEGVAIKLDTNGTHPEVLESVLADRLVDFVALDVKAVPEKYAAATGGFDVWGRVERAIQTIIDSGVSHEFRTTCYPLAVAPEDTLRIARRLSGGQRYVLQQFRMVRTLDPGAASVRPHDSDTLLHAAESCSAFVPTTVRGVH